MSATVVERRHGRFDPALRRKSKRPVSAEPAHELTRVERRYAEPALGLWIAWCLCGVGSPPKTTPEDALESTRQHIATGKLPK